MNQFGELTPTITLVCPSCGVSRDINDVIVTFETIEAGGKEQSEKKTVRTLIRVQHEIRDDEDSLVYTCGVCEYVWTGEFGGPKPFLVTKGNVDAVRNIFTEVLPGE